MCGIAGMVRRGRPADAGALARMTAALAHRGPDGHGMVHAGPAGLGHTRLAIVEPTPAGRQPVADPGGRWWVSVNGEVFNHRALRDRLPRCDYRGGGDAETVAHAIAVWGPEAVRHFEGFFAIAAVDVVERRLYLIRDAFGVKPLYVGTHADTLWFASEMRAILAAGFPRRPHRGVLRHAMLHRWANGAQTPVEGIVRVLPGHWIEVGLDDLETRARVWHDPLRGVSADAGERLRRLPRAELADLLETELRAAVRSRLMSDVPVAALCSGGVDSSLVAALAAQDVPGLVAYGASVPGQPEHDEFPWAEQACRATGVPLRRVTVDEAGWRRELVRAVAHFEYPLVHESSVALALIAAQVHADGIRVVLGGEAADELFGGYGSRHGDERARYGGGAPPPAPRTPGPDPLASLFAADPASEPARYEVEVRARALAAYAHLDPEERDLAAAVAADLQIFLPHGLNRLDKNMMRHAVECREPFLASGVVELALNLPLEHRVHPRLKGVLLDVARRHIPAAIVERPKVGFSFDPARYVAPHTRPEFLRDGRARGLFRIPERRWADTLAGLGGRSLFRLFTLEIWCRTMLDDEAPEAVEEALWSVPAPSPRRSSPAPQPLAAAAEAA